MIITITPDIERAKSIFKSIANREKFLASMTNKEEEFSTQVAEGYYEVIKELATAILLIDGFKAIGEYAHKETIEYLSKYREISDQEIMLADDLRIKRNKSSYEGKQIEKEYLKNKKGSLIILIEKLKKILNKKLNKI